MPQVERLKHTQLYFFLLLVLVVHFAWLGRRHCLCGGHIPLSGLLLGLLSRVGFIEGIRNDTGGIIVFVAVEVPFAMSPTNPLQGVRPSGDGSNKCCFCLLVSDSGVACHNGGPRLLLQSSSSSELRCQLVHFVVVRAVTLHELREGPPGRSRYASEPGNQSSRAGRTGHVSSELRGS